MADLNLPRAMTALRPALPEMVDQGRGRAPSLSVLLSSHSGLQITVDNREERIAEQPPTSGTIVSAFDGETVYERAVNGFGKKDVERAIKELIDGTSFKEYTPPQQPDTRGDFVTSMQSDPVDLSVQEKLDRCRELHRRVKDRDARIMNARVIYVESNEYSVFAGSHSDLAQRVQRLLIYVMVLVAGDDGKVQLDLAVKSGTAGWEILEFSDEELQDLVDSAVALLSAERIEPGDYQIITSPGVSGTICHESFGHGVETDMFLKKRAKAAYFIDKEVGSPLVNILDDPGHQGGFGSYFFDDEGYLSSPTVIVEDGIFRRGITDLYSATALGIPRSANGRRQDYTRKAYARMSNTYFGAGESTLEEMVAQVEHGIYLDKWSSGMEDPQGWGIQVTCRFGYEIKNGKITDRMFAPIGISGYVPEVLQSISAVGNEVLLDGGLCGKGHKEIAYVASGGPHMLLKARLG